MVTFKFSNSQQNFIFSFTNFAKTLPLLLATTINNWFIFTFLTSLIITINSHTSWWKKQKMSKSFMAVKIVHKVKKTKVLHCFHIFQTNFWSSSVQILKFSLTNPWLLLFKSMPGSSSDGFFTQKTLTLWPRFMDGVQLPQG